MSPGKKEVISEGGGLEKIKCIDTRFFLFDRNCRLKVFCFVGALVLLLCVTGNGLVAKPLKFSMGVEPKTGTLADQFMLTVVLETLGVEGAKNVQEPDLRDFEVVDSKSQTSTSTFVAENGATNLSTILTKRYTLRPKRRGKLWIGAAKVSVGGKRHQTPALTIRVQDTKGKTSSVNQIASTLELLPGFVAPTMNKQQQDLFVHSFVDKAQVVVGEQVMVTRLLYTTSEVLTLDPIALSYGDASNHELFAPKKNLKTFNAKVGERDYFVSLVSQEALFPTSIGVYQVPAYQAKVATMDTPFQAPVFVRSQFDNVVVSDLPDEMPDAMDSSYIGRFEIHANVDRNFLKSGEALTLTLIISGTGAIQRLLPPTLKFDGFEFRKPRDFEETVDAVNGQVSGERRFRYWTVPKKTGDLTIPPIHLDYYDPRLKVYARTSSLPIPIKVKENPKARAETVGALDNEKRIGADIRLLRSNTQLKKAPRRISINQNMLMSVLLGPWCVLLALFFLMKVKNRGEKNTPKARLKRANYLANRLLKEAVAGNKASSSGKQVNKLTAAIGCYLEERTGRQLKTSTRPGLRKSLAECNVSGSDIDAVLEVMKHNDAASYASGDMTAEVFEGRLHETQKLLSALGEVPMTNVGDGL